MNKTEQKLLARRLSGDKVECMGKREVMAARALVAAGLAKEFKNLSGMSDSEYKIHPFSRKQFMTKSVFCYAGTLVF